MISVDFNGNVLVVMSCQDLPLKVYGVFFTSEELFPIHSLCAILKHSLELESKVTGRVVMTLTLTGRAVITMQSKMPLIKSAHSYSRSDAQLSSGSQTQM